MLFKVSNDIVILIIAASTFHFLSSIFSVSLFIKKLYKELRNSSSENYFKIFKKPSLQVKDLDTESYLLYNTDLLTRLATTQSCFLPYYWT